MLLPWSSHTSIRNGKCVVVLIPVPRRGRAVAAHAASGKGSSLAAYLSLPNPVPFVAWITKEGALARHVARPAKMPSRRIVRDVNEDARDIARALAKTEAFARSRRDRKRVEMLFAHLKRILRLGRLRLRGPCGAQDEFTLAAIAQNLRRLAKTWSLDRHQRPMHLLPNQRGAKSLVGALPLAKKRHSRKTCQQIEAVLSHSNRRLLQQNLPHAVASNCNNLHSSIGQKPP